MRRAVWCRTGKEDAGHAEQEKREEGEELALARHYTTSVIPRVGARRKSIFSTRGGEGVWGTAVKIDPPHGLCSL
jgi:hypothetical protein